MRSGEGNTAEVVLMDAVIAGEEGRKDDEKAFALSRLVYVKGYSLAKFDEAAQWFKLVEAAVKRAGSPAAEQNALNSWGQVLLKQGRYAEAAKWLERGATVAEQEFGDLDPRTNVVLSNWANALLRIHKPKESLKLITRSIAAYEKTRGPNNPTVGSQRRVLGQTYLVLKDNQHAYEEFQKAVAIHSASIGPDSVDVAYDLDWLATTLYADGLYDVTLNSPCDPVTTPTVGVCQISGAYAGSFVVAQFLAKAVIGTVQTSNGGTPFGVAADTLVSLAARTDAGQTLSVRNVGTQAEADAALTGLSLGDFKLAVL
jgi:tetratricopeptide (TPR) repeat protein